MMMAGGDRVVDSPWMTAREAAKYARVHVSLIYREVQQGRLKAARIGRRGDYRFREGYIDAWLEATLTPLPPLARPARPSRARKARR